VPFHDFLPAASVIVKHQLVVLFDQMQGLLRLKEPAVLLRCRKEDHHHVESVLDSAKYEYASKANVHEPEILVDHDVYLPPAPSHHDAHGQFWYFFAMPQVFFWRLQYYLIAPGCLYLLPVDMLQYFAHHFISLW
jgi:hypothetical protein